jgi:hypothetical protein
MKVSVLGHSRDSPADSTLRAMIALNSTSDLQAAPDSKHATLVTVVLQRTEFRFEKSNVRNAPGKICSNLLGMKSSPRAAHRYTGCSSINERAQSRHSSAVTLRCCWTHESMPWLSLRVTLPNLLSNGQIGADPASERRGPGANEPASWPCLKSPLLWFSLPLMGSLPYPNLLSFHLGDLA